MADQNHRQAQRWIEQAQAGLLAADEQADLAAHLASCDGCRRFAASFAQAELEVRLQLSPENPRPALNPAELDRVLARIRRRSGLHRILKRFGEGARTLAWAALAAAVVFSVNWLTSSFVRSAADPAAPAESPLPANSAGPPGEPETFAAGNGTPASAESPPGSETAVSAALQRTLAAGAPVTSVAFSPDGTRVAAASEDGTVRVWRVADGSLVYALEAHTRAATSVTYSPDGRFLATGGKDGAARIWYAKSGAYFKTLFSSEVSILSVRFSPNANLMALTLSNYAVALVRLSDGIVLDSFESSLRLDIIPSTERNSYLIASAESAIWLKGDPGAPLRLNIQGQAGKSLDIVLSESGTLLASASTDGLVYLWRLFDLTIEEDSGLHNGQTTVTRLVSGNLIFKLEGHTGWVNSLDFSPDSQVLVSGGADGLLFAWSAADGLPFQTLTGHEGPVNSLDISPAGGLVASGSEDGTVRIWTLAEP